MMTPTQARWMALIEEASRCAAMPMRDRGPLKILAIAAGRPEDRKVLVLPNDRPGEPAMLRMLTSWGPGEDDRHGDSSGEWLCRAFIELAAGYAEAGSIVRRTALAPGLAALAAEVLSMMPASAVPVFPKDGVAA